MTPDWLGSPQHAVAGGVVAAVVSLASLRLGVRPWMCLALGMGAALFSEAVVEVLEYWIFNADLRVPSAARTYYDTIADLASSLVGATVGGLAAVLIGAHRRHSRIVPPITREAPPLVATHDEVDGQTAAHAHHITDSWK